MLHCPKCDAEISVNALFCAQCGFYQAQARMLRVKLQRKLVEQNTPVNPRQSDDTIPPTLSNLNPATGIKLSDLPAHLASLTPQTFAPAPPTHKTPSTSKLSLTPAPQKIKVPATPVLETPQQQSPTKQDIATNNLSLRQRYIADQHTQHHPAQRAAASHKDTPKDQPPPQNIAAQQKDILRDQLPIPALPQPASGSSTLQAQDAAQIVRASTPPPSVADMPTSYIPAVTPQQPIDFLTQMNKSNIAASKAAAQIVRAPTPPPPSVADMPTSYVPVVTPQ